MPAMRQRWLMTATLIAACGTDPDPREPTFEVVTIEVLRPSCGQVQCHSNTTKINGYAFDTLDSSRASLMKLNVHLNPQFNNLVNVLEGQGGLEQMPFDAPMAEGDRALIDSWLAAGAPGL
jgi:hypothetical protein